jgi:hypothetical protein
MESAHLLADVEPDPAADPNKLTPDILRRWYRDLKDAITLGLLIPVGRRSPGLANDLLEPARVVAWARTRDTPDRSIRDTLLIIIAALAKAANIDTSKPSKAAGEIEKLTVEIGARVSARRIEDHLKRIPGSIEDRQSS